MTWFDFDSRDQQVAALQQVISSQLELAITQRGEASWAVSGGSTPEPLFVAMQSQPLHWSKVSIALVDERWVDPDHPRSNQAFVRSTLCQGKASAAKLVAMKTADAHAIDAEIEVNQRYASLPLPFDSVLLGMGPDGHTASLFPGAERLELAMDPHQAQICRALTAIQSEVTGNEIERMTLTAAAIAAARQVVLMICGEQKRQLLQQALADHADLPIARLMRLADIDVYWAP